MKKNFKIGDIAYPRDNSYAVAVDTLHYEILSSEHRVSPANIRGQMPDPVEILSEPFDMTHKVLGLGDKTHEFIIVKYKGRVCRILNDFHDSKEEAEKETRHKMLDIGFYDYGIIMPIDTIKPILPIAYKLKT